MGSQYKKFFITAALPFVLLGAGVAYLSFASASGNGDMLDADSQMPLEFLLEDVGSGMQNAFETLTYEVKQQIESDFNKLLIGLPEF